MAKLQTNQRVIKGMDWIWCCAKLENKFNDIEIKDELNFIQHVTERRNENAE